MQMPQFFKSKKVVGRGLSIRSDGIRLATSGREGKYYRVSDLQEIKIASQEPEEIRQAIRSLELPLETPVAVNLWDEGLKFKRVALPPMGTENIAGALQFQVRSEPIEGKTPSEMVVRYSRLKSQKTEGGKLNFLVYGISKEALERKRRFYHDLGLCVVAAEPSVVSLVFLQEIFNENEEREDQIRAIFHLHERQGECIGLKGNQLLFREGIGISDKPANDDSFTQLQDLILPFQQAMDEFLESHHLPEVHEIVLAGDWEPSQSALIASTLGVSCRHMGDVPDSALQYSEDFQKALGYVFAPEIALSLFPWSNL